MSLTDPSKIKGVNTNLKIKGSKSPLRQSKFKHLESTQRQNINHGNPSTNNDEYLQLKQSIKNEILNEIYQSQHNNPQNLLSAQQSKQ